MINTHKNSLLASALASMPLMTTESKAEDSCKDVLTYAGRNHMSRFTLEEKKAWIYSHKCGGSTRSSDAGLGFLVDAVPIDLSFSSSSTKQWCEENKRLSSYFSVAQEIESTVSEPAIQSWASCMSASAMKLNTRVRVASNDAVIQLIVNNGTAYEEKLTGVLAHSVEGASVQCSLNPNSEKPESLPVGREVLINCERSSIEVQRKGSEYRILPAGSITLATTLTSFLYNFPEKFIDEPPPPEQPQRIALSLKGMHAGTRVHWEKGRKSHVIDCTGLKPPASNFEIIVINTKSERVHSFNNPRGRCGTPPHCDSAGEFCAEEYYTSACFINKEWHDWYKQSAERQNIPYSKESVCGT